jgi:Peptidogalycan biosysnthesis/recognition
VRVLSRRELPNWSRWPQAFPGNRKDHRYYEIVEDTIQPVFDYRYFAIVDEYDTVRGIQPFFLLDQDLTAAANKKVRTLVNAIRRIQPRFLKIRTLMVGCAAGEGHLDGVAESFRANAETLAADIVRHASDLRASIVVLKEFPARYRPALQRFLEHGFIRIPSLPMTRLNIDYSSFEEYTVRALNSSTRRKLRKNLKAAAQSEPIELSVLIDVTSIIDEIYPLYLQVYERSKLHFEKLTGDFFSRLGRSMPDKVRFFVWRQQEKVVAFTLCMLEGDAIYAEYIGLDYGVALDLHLYHYAVRDMISWAIANRYKWFRSSALNYDPKLHMRHVLDPIDLYVRHTSPLANAVLKIVLPWIEPTRSEPTLKKFRNYQELWD